VKSSVKSVSHVLKVQLELIGTIKCVKCVKTSLKVMKISVNLMKSSNLSILHY